MLNPDHRTNVWHHRLLLLAAVLLTVAAQGVAGDEERVFSTFDASNGLADNSAQTIKCTKTGRMVVSTIGHINFYDGDAFIHVDPTAKDFFPLPKYTGHYRLYFDKAHHLWLKDKYTVTCVDLMMERFIPNVGAVIRKMGMKKDVEDLFGDSNSHIWFMAGRKLYGVDDGVEIPVLGTAELQDVDVYDGRHLLQFYANGVVSAFDIKTMRHKYDAAAFDNGDSVRYTSSSVVYADGSKFYQIRNSESDAVLLCFDVVTRQWKRLMEVPYHLNNMVLHEGQLYIASEYGYWEYDTQTGRKTHHETLRLTGGRQLVTDVNTIAFDRQGGMWMGTERRGLLYSKVYESPFRVYSWDRPEAKRYAELMDRTLKQESLPRHVNCRYLDSRGWVWMGLYTGLRVQPSDGTTPFVLTKKDGLLNEMVRCVIEDDNHDMWVATSFGISHLMIDDGKISQIESYYHTDDVPNESFVNGRAMKLSDGTIVMQSLDHIVAFNINDFNPERIKKLVLAPKLVRLMVNGHNIVAGTQLDGKVILDRAVSRVKEITVDYDQNTLSLTFSALNFMRPLQTYYRVRVKGRYDEWKVWSNSNSDGFVDHRGILHLPLVGLEPGSYQVEVQASMNPDYWPLEPYRWIINVEQPWWRTTGIYILLGLLLSGLLVVNFYYYNRNMRMKMMRNNEEGDILRRVRNYVSRCDAQMDEVLTPYSGEIAPEENGDNEFVEAMLKIVPYLRERKEGHVTMSDLARMTDMEVGTLFELLSNNLYKSPRRVVGRLRLQRAAEMFLYTNKQIEEVTDECGFVSPNYLIACFFHQYRKTPEDYRNSTPR